jgi:predicted nucleotidyltransferase
MRLTTTEIAAITTCAKRFFGENVSVRLFGSRADESAAGGDAGGDIDLHIEAETAELATLRNQLAFSAELKTLVGEQRIDVVVRPPGYDPQPIDRIALETGVTLP